MTPVLIDCDPGIDDAIALLLAFASPELEVAGLSVVAGNVSVEQAVRNAVRVCDLAGAPPGLPIARGHAGPLARAVRVPDEPVHGPGGLGGVVLADSTRRLVDEPAPAWLARQVRQRPGELTIVALGPLTNVASVLHAHPDVAPAIREIVVMGGAAFAPGNITPAAEFNFYADPEAARFVAEAGVPLRIVGLDVTRTALVPKKVSAGLDAEAATMLGYLTDRYAERHGVDACAVHDALAVAAVLRPELLGWTEAHVTVECAGEFTRGALVADVLGRTEPTARVATTVDAAGFVELLSSRLSSNRE